MDEYQLYLETRKADQRVIPTYVGRAFGSQNCEYSFSGLKYIIHQSGRSSKALPTPAEAMTGLLDLNI